MHDDIKRYITDPKLLASTAIAAGLLYAIKKSYDRKSRDRKTLEKFGIKHGESDTHVNPEIYGDIIPLVVDIEPSSREGDKVK